MSSTSSARQQHESESDGSYESSDNGTTTTASVTSIKVIHSGHRRTGSEPMPSSMLSSSPSILPAVSVSATTMGSVGSGAGVPPLPPPRAKGRKREQRSTDWEVLEGLKEGQTYDRVPKKFEGFVLKKRKWPVKGYHKRYFVLDKGLIVYGKSGWDLTRGKVCGNMDAGLSVISINPRDGRIDIDAEDCIHHIKIKPMEKYMEWLEQLKQHRLYRQHVLSSKDISAQDEVDHPTSPHAARIQSPGNGNVMRMERRNSLDKELSLVEKDLSNLEGILTHLPHPKKDDESKMKDFLVLGKEVVASLRSLARGLGNINSRETDNGTAPLRLALNQALQQNAELKSRLNRIHRESHFGSGNTMTLKFTGQSDTIRSYGSNMSNSEYYDAIDMPGMNPDEDRTSSEDFSSEDEGEADSIHSEVSEQPKFEAEHGIVAPQKSPSGISSSSSSNGTMSPRTRAESFMSQGRRAQLPCPAPSGNEVPTLWTILRKNIGKDLSRISMPVTLNEPLGVLQRMCEELEYSELLDAATKESDPVQRIALIAAFAVSGYSSTFFRTHKPFNPLLGETYECVREDKGFRFISEQVSHHPPVSAAHAEGRGWSFWEETQPKTKFWGKSMEIQPVGEVHIVFPKFGEHYSYNKATTCVHNLFSAQSRWVDLYGEVTVKGNGLTANLTFLKASYWSARKHEVFGTVANSDGTTVRNLFGNWNEAFYAGQPPSAKCLWRMGAMPEDHSRYYGFTRFAIELNECASGLSEKISITDTRLRPDQRLLEEGDLAGAERMKLVIEQKQRDRRKRGEEIEDPFLPLWFQKTGTHETTGESQWEFNGSSSYWEQRKGGFKGVTIEPLW